MRAVLLSAAVAGVASQVVPGKVLPAYPQSYNMSRSTAIMICNSTGHVDAEWAAPWSLVDVDWNSAKPSSCMTARSCCSPPPLTADSLLHQLPPAVWSSAKPMNCEEDMLLNLQQIRAVNPNAITWLYRNGVKALPWFTSVRTKLENPAYWGWFMPLANCSPAPGVYVCGPNATDNLYHDFEQTPSGDCGVGVQCGEYVFNHRNESLRSFLLGEYFFRPTGANASGNMVNGFYVDDDWSSSGPSEMDKDAVQKMGMTPADVQAMTAAWAANEAAWRQALVAAGKFEWFLFYGGQQTAPGWNQTDPAATCQQYMETNCGADAPSQSGALFFGFSRVKHSQAWPLPSPTQDVAAFLITRGPYAWVSVAALLSLRCLMLCSACRAGGHPYTHAHAAPCSRSRSVCLTAFVRADWVRLDWLH